MRQADTTTRTGLVLDTLEMALCSRQRAGPAVQAGLVHDHDAGSQYTSFAFTRRLSDAGVDASVGSVGDAYHNALAESTIGLYKTEKIRRERPWRTLAEVELATPEWVHWFNAARLHSACGRLSRAQFEQRYIDNRLTQQQPPPNEAGAVKSGVRKSGGTPAWHRIESLATALRARAPERRHVEPGLT